MPTFFFQQVQSFFDVIFYAVRDSKPLIREGAVAALRSALVVTSQRETKEAQRPTWYEKGGNVLNIKILNIFLTKGTNNVLTRHSKGLKNRKLKTRV